ncbi:MAG: 3-oxoacyl-ACP reductase FabG [Sulfurospirillum sp.]|nr:3-oxoacyl-ACP reductase FabG [Sulfurospirillum sp.]MBL0702355.1 3-oxoacyl-ACP reductase FabG [Sulfurospirillum sp.]
MKFSGTNVLITGAASGIGKQLAITLASYGLKVWINYRSRPKEADLIQAEIESNGGKAAVIGFDVADEDAFIEGIKSIVSSDGELSYLVNNAGITNDKLALRMKKNDFTTVLDINLTSSFVGCREALKVMSKKRFGSVVNISSIVAESGNIGQVNYTASKGGLNAMTKSFALEGSARGIRYNAVSPGFIATKMTDKLSDEVKESYISKIPLKRFGNPKDIAEAVAFLLSDNSTYITGEVLKVNGGMYM